MSERETTRSTWCLIAGDTKPSHVFLSSSPKSVGKFPWPSLVTRVKMRA
jgi:hypothetical protein